MSAVKAEKSSSGLSGANSWESSSKRSNSEVSPPATCVGSGSGSAQYSSVTATLCCSGGSAAASGGRPIGSSGSAGGVFHCFTETEAVARAALDLGFYISFSGILTFKNAQDLRDVARFVPDDRLLIETDSPYLAPVPYRGKVNNPSYVPFVAHQLAAVRQTTVEAIAAATSRNFERLFKPS